jgi:hypothetical protein
MTMKHKTLILTTFVLVLLLLATIALATAAPGVFEFAAKLVWSG